MKNSKFQIPIILAFMIFLSYASLAQGSININLDGSKKVVFKYSKEELKKASDLILKTSAGVNGTLIIDKQIDGVYSTLSSIDFIENKTYTKSLTSMKSACDHCSSLRISFKNDYANFVDGNSTQIKSFSIIIKAENSFNTLSANVASMVFVPPSMLNNASPCEILYDEKSPDYILELDFSNSVFTSNNYKKNKDNQYDTVKRMHLKRGYTLGVLLIEPSNAYDTIKVRPTFLDRNLENQGDFEELFSSLKQSDKENDDSTDQEPTEATPHASLSENEKNNIAALDKLIAELNTYNIQKETCLPQRSVWKTDKSIINQNIAKSLEITFSNLEELAKQLKLLTNNTSKIEDVLYELKRAYTYDLHSVFPIQIKDNDELSLEFEMKKEGKKPSSSNYSYLIRGGFKIDFSVGLGYSFLQNQTYQTVSSGNRSDTTFYVDPNFNTTDSITGLNSVSQKKIQKLNDDLNISIATMAHFYSRTGKYANIGLSTGFLVNSKGDFSYLLGGSLILGQKQRLILSGGLNFGKVTELNPKYKLDKEYDASDFENVSDSQLGLESWKTGAFISLTWNFGSVKLSE